jgi:hypothetical protein
VGLQSRFRGIHQNKLAFMLGTGVSIMNENLDLIKPFITMALNESILLFPEPTYFFSCDWDVGPLGLMEKAVEAKNTIPIFAGEFDYEEQEVNGKIKYIIPRKTGKTHENTLREIDDALILGVLSSHVGVNLLYIMGCNPIVLIGIDGGPTNGASNFYFLEENFKYTTKEMRARYGETFEVFITNIKARFNASHYDSYMTGNGAWEKLKQDVPTIPIINTSLNSGITCFTKMSLEEVLANYGDKI